MKKIPTWITGLIGLATTLILFVGLFLNNINIATIVLIGIALGVASYFLIYIVLAKDPSPIEGGRNFIYRFEKYRLWAVGAMIAIILSIIISLSVESNRKYIMSAFLTYTPISTDALEPIIYYTSTYEKHDTQTPIPNTPDPTQPSSIGEMDFLLSIYARKLVDDFGEFIGYELVIFNKGDQDVWIEFIDLTASALILDDFGSNNRFIPFIEGMYYMFEYYLRKPIEHEIKISVNEEFVEGIVSDDENTNYLVKGELEINRDLWIVNLRIPTNIFIPSHSRVQAQFRFLLDDYSQDFPEKVFRYYGDSPEFYRLIECRHEQDAFKLVSSDGKEFSTFVYEDEAEFVCFLVREVLFSHFVDN